MRRPSEFLTIPRESVGWSHEAETVALNIMVILVREGNKFKKLSWETYKKHRERDGNFTELEKSLFDDVVGYCSSAEKAETFSPEWRK